jgi:hypothetical protein
MFNLDTDTLDHQLEAVIMQDRNPLSVIHQSSIQLKSGTQLLSNTEGCYQLLKHARDTRIYCYVTIKQLQYLQIIRIIPSMD